MRGYEIVKDCKVENIHEFIVEWNGYSFLVMYGQHLRGWFISVPNWNAHIEASEPDDIRYNQSKLDRLLNVAGAGQAIANAVFDHYCTHA